MHHASQSEPNMADESLDWQPLIPLFFTMSTPARKRNVPRRVRPSSQWWAHVFDALVFRIAGSACLIFALLAAPPVGLGSETKNPPIDRFALVTRHNLNFHEPKPDIALTVGNGNFAFTTDATGLQTFPAFHHPAIPLTTMANWAWHSDPNPNHYSLRDVERPLQIRGKTEYFPTVGFPYENNDPASDWLNQNPHHFSLGQIGLVILKKDGSEAAMSDLKNISQELDLWTGTIHCHFEVEGVPVQVVTVVHPAMDLVASRIESALFHQGRLAVRLRFPYPTYQDDPSDWEHPDRHKTVLKKEGDRKIHLWREADAAKYQVQFEAQTNFQTRVAAAHEYILSPNTNADSFEIACDFAASRPGENLPAFSETLESTRRHWQSFWQTGGVVDFSGSTDARATELERRVILSQYLTAIQSAGDMPPQETGLTRNSWNGKFHLEVTWFHEAHFALWGHPEMLERSLEWYLDFLPRAKALAKTYGQRGARWPKMIGPEGRESPNHINPFLLWQQPTIIYLAELSYRTHPNEATLKKYRRLVFDTARFLTSALHYNGAMDRYELGPPVVPAAEIYEIGNNGQMTVWDPAVTFNPAFELAYWRFGLQVAQSWRERLGMKRQPEWDQMLAKLSPLPATANPDPGHTMYLQAENGTDLWTNPKRRIQHPAFLWAKGLLPGAGVDDTVMANSLKGVLSSWDKRQLWAQNFTTMAMTATRLGLPGLAVDSLFLDAPNNNFALTGHSAQWGRPVYLPANGSLLGAMALMTAGYDGCKESLPGFPKDGTWKVQFENIAPLP